MDKFKPLTWKIAVLYFSVGLIVAALLAWGGNRVLTPPATRHCHQNMATLQAAVNSWNNTHSGQQKMGFQIFGFPDRVQKELIPSGYLKQSVPDLTQGHSYYLQRNGFVNCRVHPRNPQSLYIMGVIILGLIASLMALGISGYQIPWTSNRSDSSK